MEFDLTKVYTAVNADDLKPGDKVLVADDIHRLKQLFNFDDGKDVVELKNILPDTEEARFRVLSKQQGAFEYKYLDFSLAYLIEHVPEKKHRPFKDIQELLDVYDRKVGIPMLKRKGYKTPFLTREYIWIKSNGTNGEHLITGFEQDDDGEDCVVCNGTHIPLCVLDLNFTFLDGSPCGVEE